MSTVVHFNLSDYDRLIQCGFFDAPHPRRIELIHGELREMNPIGPIHEDIVDILNEWSMEVTRGEDIRVRVQQSVGIPALDSAPQPDIAWVRRKNYRTGRPQDRDILLIIEVAHSSLPFDCGEKLSIYAVAAVPEYWVVNVAKESVEQFRVPSESGYRWQRTLSKRQSAAPLILPTAKLAIRRLFE